MFEQIPDSHSFSERPKLPSLAATPPSMKYAISACRDNAPCESSPCPILPWPQYMTHSSRKSEHTAGSVVNEGCHDFTWSLIYGVRNHSSHRHLSLQFPQLGLFVVFLFDWRSCFAFDCMVVSLFSFSLNVMPSFSHKGKVQEGTYSPR